MSDSNIEKIIGKDIIEEKNSKWEDDNIEKSYKVAPPRDKDGNLYHNTKGKANRKGKIANNKKAIKVKHNMASWNSEGGIIEQQCPFEKIPDNIVRLMAQKIEEGIPRHIAARACAIPEKAADYRIEHGLCYIDRKMTEDGVIEAKTYIKDVILKAEANQEAVARQSIMLAMKKGNTKVAQEFLEKQKEDAEKTFHDRAEYRTIARDMGLSKKEYIWCLDVLNGTTQQQASINVGWHKSLNMYHYRMNPQVKEFIKVIKESRRKEMLDGMTFSKETAASSMMYSLSILINEIEKPGNTKQDIVNIAREIRNSAVEMGKATNLYPKEDQTPSITNIAVLAGENTSAVLDIIGKKHQTQALNITEFTNAKEDTQLELKGDAESDTGTIITTEEGMSE